MLQVDFNLSQKHSDEVSNKRSKRSLESSKSVLDITEVIIRKNRSNGLG